MLHAVWALGSHWPAGSERELAERVLAAGDRNRIGSGKLPPAPATAAVSVALLGAAGIVRTVAAGAPSRALRRAAWGVSAVFLARGALLVPADLIGGLDDTFDRLDLAIYSPLCLTLGAGTAIVARSASPTIRADEAGSSALTSST